MPRQAIMASLEQALAGNGHRYVHDVAAQIHDSVLEPIHALEGAFAALLAAAQSLLPPNPREPGEFYGDEFTMHAAYGAIEDLDEQLPGWRTWTP